VHEVGLLGESLASDFLIAKSYKILYRNYSMPRWGEIDIIALDKDEIVFVEVKTRTNNNYGDPLDAITPHKIKSLKRTINYFLTHEGREYLDRPYRIDAISILVDAKNKTIISKDQVSMLS